MGALLRAAAFVLFFAGVAGATYGAYQVFEPEVSFTAVELTPPEGPMSLVAGGAIPTQVGVQNTGDAPVSVALRAGAGPVTFTSAVDNQTVPAGGNRMFPGTLTVERAFEGTADVSVEAIDPASGRVLATTSFPVEVFAPQEPTLTVEAIEPAAVPGGALTVRVAIENPMPSAQQFTLTAAGLEAAFTPATLNVPRGSAGVAKGVLQVPADATGRLEATIEAVTASGVGGSSSVDVPVVESGALHAELLGSSFEVSPGGPFSVPVILVTNLDEGGPVNVSGTLVRGHTFGEAPAAGALGGFVALQAPDGLSGETEHGFDVSVAGLTRSITFTLEPAEGDQAALGTSAQVDYVGRLTNGEVFDSSLPRVLLGPFPKADFFQERLQTQALTVELSDQPRVIRGFFDAVLGTHTGELTTTTIPPSEGYGGARVHQNLSATTTLQRVEEADRFLRDFPKQQLPPEFDIQNKDVGDEITYRTEASGVPIVFRFRVAEESDSTVTLERLEAVGDKTTFYAPWPNATEVIEVREDSIVFRTTPPEIEGPFLWDAGGPGTHQAAWGNTTTLATVNETAIVLRHAPEEGLTYEAAGPGQPPTAHTVEQVTEDTIQVSRANPSPLGGKTLVFDIYVRGVQAAPASNPLGMTPSDGHTEHSHGG